MSLPNETALHDSSWRQIALVTVLVVLVHAALLATLPQWGGQEAPLPLEQRFVTRTIVLAPPVAPAPPAAEAAPKATPKKAAEHHAAPAPRRSAAPHPDPAPQEASPPASVMATEDAAAAMSRIELTPPPLPEAPAAAEPAPVNAAGASEGKGTAAGSTAGTEGQAGAGDAEGAGYAPPGAGQDKKVHASVRLNFEMLGQRGVQPWKGVFGELLWLQDGSEYNARLALKVMWKTIRSQTSVGHVDAGGIVPDRFSETRKTEVASHLVRGENKIVFSNNAPSVPLLPGAQDRLSVVMQLGALLAGDPARYPEGSRIAIQTVGPKDAGIWTFVVEGTERISVPAGEYEVRRLSRSPRGEYDYKLELWLAPELGWLPARMRQTQQDGDVIDLQLRDLSPP
ncbi:DUF3108 domain-containing protein [Variovorax sp. OV329]|uniref:DUF3108 domain-containing protein n=1 Tax=Variovorax sp. OV329 TaxID=1882825 RepID=UPI0008E9E7FD|nr:DUF3108 domain-containing protein [Variovorax sp. OV329]SFM98858.1 Protein of unknown function [Variovorax sp. OV329]